MADIIDAYALAEAWDGMFVRPGEVRTAGEPVPAALQAIEPGELRFPATVGGRQEAAGSQGP
ncbi:hypothetical protein GCM10011579_055220 [Streptomyces albiflavescens]|uniref:Uncharacterized protein n=1 Tax=Streptomyces albiflavescens TaxID=1623582 RepID=A0A917Y939_9ACTN|nr:hypothetical protein [Streptomyces albiflavescens]GGN75296.1 hypothetical protein GCM10011579_055220 [Streptomyces albiflavescens]